MPPGTDPDAAAETVWREKRREDRLRRQVAVGRWVWSEALDRLRLARVLGDHGIRAQPRNTWLQELADQGRSRRERGCGRSAR